MLTASKPTLANVFVLALIAVPGANCVGDDVSRSREASRDLASDDITMEIEGKLATVRAAFHAAGRDHGIWERYQLCAADCEPLRDDALSDLFFTTADLLDDDAIGLESTVL